MDKVGAIGVSDGVGVGVGTGVGVGVGVGSATGNDFFTVTPLFHNNLLPDFMQVNFLPLAVAVAPALVHFAPALTAALAETCVVARIKRQAIATKRLLLAREVNKFPY
jgi:hypothetical protein